ncbi:unnamed protein product [Caenorhabditis bovis]|uniref:PAP-associated domain-containing protein n=1 Tax=Caenorhabditis bovis TaxID=2654633 RepID=A0A8S1F946_9PELO|nr:unnamed protein product [Caenorhabditis bovis]
MSNEDDAEELVDFDQAAYHVYFNSEPYNRYITKWGSRAEYSYAFDSLSSEMHQYWNEIKQPESERLKKLQFCKDLKEAIKRNCPTWNFDVVPTGSSVTGLAAKNSDLDITIHIPQATMAFVERHEPIDVRAKEKHAINVASFSILRIVRRILENDEQIKNKIMRSRDQNYIQLVPASIQILSLVTADGIECDIGVVIEDFLSSLHNSFLLNHFNRIEPRFAPLCAIIKLWADKTEVRKPKEGGFNSYAIVLLIIHFLQCGTYPPILPHLPKVYEKDEFFAQNEHTFPACVDFSKPLPRALPEVTKNASNIAQLFLQFLNYYVDFNFHKNYISLPTGKVQNRKELDPEKARLHHQKSVYIEDPYDNHNPGRTVRNLAAIREAFRSTLALFEPVDDVFTCPTLEQLLNCQIARGELIYDNDDNSDDEEVDNFDFDDPVY